MRKNVPNPGGEQYGGSGENAPDPGGVELFHTFLGGNMFQFCA
jgi:hypothetical protein